MNFADFYEQSLLLKLYDFQKSEINKMYQFNKDKGYLDLPIQPVRGDGKSNMTSMESLMRLYYMLKIKENAENGKT